MALGLRRRLPRHYLVATVGLLVLAVATLGAAALLGGVAVPGIGPQTHEFVIPAGASKRADVSGELNGIPRLIEADVGDKLVITNYDERLQIVAGYPIESGKTVSIPLTRAGRFETSCSVHKKKSTTLLVTD